jgi:hypothetical protein
MGSFEDHLVKSRVRLITSTISPTPTSSCKLFKARIEALFEMLRGIGFHIIILYLYCSVYILNVAPVY